MWARVVVVGPGLVPIASWTIGSDDHGPDRPDLGAVDRLARLRLAARRWGLDLRLEDIGPELVELLVLAGLSDLLR